MDGNGVGLDPGDRKKAEERTSLAAAVVYEAIRREGQGELERPTRALAWSGLAAGLSMGFSMMTEAFLHAHLPDASWRPLVSKLGYSTGFLIVILGRQQLFTENTLTVILPLLQNRDARTLANVLRLWAAVLAANLVGVALFAFSLSPLVFEAPVLHALREIARETVSGTAVSIGLKGIFAGWLIALMVWLVPSAEAARVWVVVIITYVVGLGGLSHVIAGSAEALYLVHLGELSWMGYGASFLVPSLLGNIVGGVSLVAMLNHAQVVAGRDEQ